MRITQRADFGMLAQVFSEQLKMKKVRVLQFAYAHGALSSSWLLDEGKSADRRLRITAMIGQVLAISAHC